MWNTIELLTNHHMTRDEWQTITGKQFVAIEEYVQPTDSLAYYYPCPRLAANGCPRRIIESENNYHAICSHHEKRCQNLTLSRTDALIYELDYTRLNQTIASTLKASLCYTPIEEGALWQVGYYSPIGQQRFPVYMILALSQEQFRNLVYNAIALSRDPFIIIAPTQRYITEALLNITTLHHAQFIILQDNPSTDRDLQTFLARHIPHYTETPKPGYFPTPTGLTWEQLMVCFEADDVITIKWKGQEATSIDRLHIPGMYNNKSATKKETIAWSLLKLFAKHQGFIESQGQPLAHVVQKQKQLLCSRLKEYFQMEDDPIIWSYKEHGYRTRFTIKFDPCLIWSGRESIK